MVSEACLPAFDTDIFISYSHIDNEAFGEDQSHWVSDLHQRLKVRLHQLVGGPVSIWRDVKLTGNDVFDDALIERLERARILISILSPRYLQSEWCVRELESFVAAAKSNCGIQVGNKARVFKVLKTPVPLPKQPGEMQRLLGYDFYHELESGKAREFHLDPSPEGRRAYWARLDDLAQDIQTLLLELWSVRPGPIVTSTPLRETTVYLAEAALDLKSARDSLRRELEGRGYNVLPNAPLPLDGEGLIAAVREGMERSCLTIHPLGARYGTVPEGDERSVAHIQIDLAVESTSDGARRSLIWIPDDLKAPEGRQKAFIAETERRSVPSAALEILQVSLEAFKTYALDKLDGASKPAVVPAPQKDVTRIYLICAQNDFEAVKPIQTYLEDQGFAVTLPLREGTEIEIREDHQDSLVLCDAVLIHYGAAHEFWLRTKLRDLVKAPGWGRSKPLLAKAVYLAPPDTLEKQTYQNNEALLLRGSEQFSPATLEPFVAQLRGAVVKYQ